MSLSVLAKGVSESYVSLDWDHISLVEALHDTGNILHKNILLDQSVEGTVTLHVTHLEVMKLFQLLLDAHQLTRVVMGDTWLIVPQHEWGEYKESEYKLRESLSVLAPLTTKCWQMRYAKVDAVAHVLQENGNSMLSKRGHLHMDPRTNLLYVEDTAEQIAHIDGLIQQMDVPVKQILIETYLASVDSEYERNLGVEFAARADGRNRASEVSRSKYSLLVATLADGSLLDVRLAALENSGHAELVSSPRLFTANQQTAMIESGEEIPYQEESASGGTIIAFKKAVLSLKVTPQLLPKHQVLLQIQLSQDKPSQLMVHGVPAINTRKLVTNVLAEDGQTIVLGGIYETDTTAAEQGLPILSHLPLLGVLFRQNDTARTKRELLIFVTPKVISTHFS